MPLALRHQFEQQRKQREQQLQQEALAEAEAAAAREEQLYVREVAQALQRGLQATVAKKAAKMAREAHGCGELVPERNGVRLFYVFSPKPEWDRCDCLLTVL